MEERDITKEVAALRSEYHNQNGTANISNIQFLEMLPAYCDWLEEKLIAAQDTIVGVAAQTNNSDYATALDVYQGFLFSISHDMNRRNEFIKYCKQRLHSAKAPNDA